MALLILSSFATESISQDFTSFGINGLNGYDFKNHRDITSIAFNSYLWYFNFGVDYRINSKIEIKKRSDGIGFIGVGYFNRYQIQIGRSTSNITYIRQRTDWTLGELGFKWKGNKWDNPLDGITLSAYIDKAINDPRQNWIVGIGVGYSIRITGILH